MQVSHPGQGERRAIVGYVGQYRVSASLILDGLQGDYMEWVRVADPEAGQVDDLQLGSQGRIDAYQGQMESILQIIYIQAAGNRAEWFASANRATCARMEDSPG